MLKFLCNFIEIALRHGYSPVNLLHILRTLFPRNTSVGLHLDAGNPVWTSKLCAQINEKQFIKLLMKKSHLFKSQKIKSSLQLHIKIVRQN